jgi:hypothetical protein
MFEKDIDIKEFTNNLFNLYTLYQSYAWENDRLKIKIEIHERMLNISLYKDNVIIDYLNILFDESEFQKYNFISILLVTKILEKRVVYYNSLDNSFTNSKQLPYLIILVKNKQILENLILAISFINNNQDDKLYDYIDDAYKRLKFKNKRIESENDDIVSNKVFLTKALKREGHYE